jgi:tRNA A37 threonylcarbamoyladenosine synthetase subunit TsaC/SUA5/YrdC
MTQTSAPRSDSQSAEVLDAETGVPVHWDAAAEALAVELLRQEGHIVVSPTKVGYIILTSDRTGLERKFTVKNRARNKPGVVLCSSMDQLRELAQLTGEAEAFYRTHWDQDVLMGCILPWRPEAAERHLGRVGEFVTDERATSCFVVRFGRPAENIVRTLWEKDGRLVFASSANPSGKGNRGRIEGIGPAIAEEADLVIEADDYVRSIQPNETADTRYEQGVMVSFVDEAGQLVPEQHGQRGVEPVPTLIRKGLDLGSIMANLAAAFPSWDYRQGQYY